jgi:hypothetical protein
VTRTDAGSSSFLGQRSKGVTSGPIGKEAPLPLPIPTSALPLPSPPFPSCLMLFLHITRTSHQARTLQSAAQETPAAAPRLATQSLGMPAGRAEVSRHTGCMGTAWRRWPQRVAVLHAAILTPCGTRCACSSSCAKSGAADASSSCRLAAAEIIGSHY